MIRVVMPLPLRELARIEGELSLDVAGPVTIRAVVDVIEAEHPALVGTIRDKATGQRRPFLRFFACDEDWSLQSPDEPLPASIAAGEEPLLIVGAVAGG